MAKRPVPTGSPEASLPAHVWGMLADAVPAMHPAGRPFVAAALTAGVFGWRLGWVRRASLVSAGALALFFREPKRVPPTLAGAVVAPADGEVALVDEAVPPAELGLGGEPLPRVSIFLSVLDVHVQRAPVAGTVAAIAYKEGDFLPADVPEASVRNERNAVRIETGEGVAVGVVQIAGLVARRIVCDVAPGDALTLGQTYGLIRFGSRVDTYLPKGTALRPIVGQRTIGGETILAVLG